MSTPGVETCRAVRRAWMRPPFTIASNAGTIFSGLPSLYNHEVKGLTATSVLADLRKAPVGDPGSLRADHPAAGRCRAIGNAGGFKMMLPGSHRPRPPKALVESGGRRLSLAANKDSKFLPGVFTLFGTRLAVSLCRYRPGERPRRSG